MNDVNWTDSQKKAINKNGNLLVSAAAGSGKTAVLVERIFRLLSTGEAGLSDFLIVTFTKLAATELRIKIEKRLSEAARTNPGMEEHIRDIASAEIGTIHSFCGKVLRRKSEVVGISPNFAIAEDWPNNAQKIRLLGEVLNNILKKATPEEKKDYTALFDALYDDKEDLIKRILRIYDILRTKGLDVEYLKHNQDVLLKNKDLDFFSSDYNTITGAEFRQNVSEAKESFEKVVFNENEAEIDAKKEIESIIDTFINSNEKLKLQSSMEKLEKLTRDENENIKKAANNIYIKLSKISGKKIKEDIEYTYTLITALYNILSAFENRIKELKREYNIVDYSDLEKLALMILLDKDGRPTEHAADIGKKYKYIFVDEYQDTNKNQDKLFRAISGNSKMFIVGDIKQSIYQFRSGDPKIFNEYRSRWNDPKAESADPFPEGSCIFMNDNFRCSEPIVEFVNTVSNYMFRYGGIGYSPENDNLIFGKNDDNKEKVEVIYSGRGSADEEVIVADRIEKLLKEGKYRPKDIAIFARSNDLVKKYGKALKERKIPVSAQNTDRESDTAFDFILNILYSIDNPSRDTSLAGVMMSSIYNFTMEELLLIREKKSGCTLYDSVKNYSENSSDEDVLNEKCRKLIGSLDRFRQMERGMNADRFIDFVYSELDLYRAAEIDSSPFGLESMKAIHKIARNYEKGVYSGLYGLLRYIEDNKKARDSSGTPAAGYDTVTINTIHKSKGLEYPVVFLVSSFGGYKRINDPILFDEELGFGFKGTQDNYIYSSLKHINEQNNKKEEMRLLYVALTRAREKLIVTGKANKGLAKHDICEEMRQAANGANESTVLGNNDYMSIILQSLFSQECSDYSNFCEVKSVNELAEKERIKEVPSEETEAEKIISNGRLSEEQKMIIRNNINFEYPFSYLSGIPVEVATTRLYPDALDFDPGERYYIESLNQRSREDAPEMEMPLFLSGKDNSNPAYRGTCTHAFLEFADFRALASGKIESELKRLCDKGFLTEKMANIVNLDHIEKFGKSEFLKKILGAEKIFREQNFFINLPAFEFTSNSELMKKLKDGGEEISVVGTIDCILQYKDGNMAIVDYKTDSLTEYELKNQRAAEKKLIERHRLQLSYYKKACEKIFSKQIKEVYIYSLPLGKEILLDI